MFARAGILVVTAFILPYLARPRPGLRQVTPALFHEAYIEADLAVCEHRDPKDLYKKARAGQIHDFTGISAPYEPPLQAELVVSTAQQTVDTSLAILLGYVERHFTCADASNNDGTVREGKTFPFAPSSLD